MGSMLALASASDLGASSFQLPSLPVIPSLRTRPVTSLTLPGSTQIPRKRERLGMGNPLTDRVKIGTIGELLVQTRLLQYHVQAAPPIKDSGNDLIAVRGEAFRGVQVKTTAGNRVNQPQLPEHYHIVAIVVLAADEANLYLDKAVIYLVPRAVIEEAGRLPRDLRPF